MAGKAVRPYQVDVVLNAMRLLENGGFILKVPQGTGKSLISQIIVRLRLDRRNSPRSKALVIAPTVELRKQYVRLAAWISRAAGDSPGRNVGELDESRGHPKNFLEVVDKYSLLVTTPKFLANRLRLLEGYWTDIDLCILDEVDLWSIAPVEDLGVRIHRHMETILPELRRRGVDIVGLTATPPTEETRTLLGRFGCGRECSVVPEAIGEYLPRLRIILVPCPDAAICSVSASLSEEIDEAQLRLRKQLRDFQTDIYQLVMRACGAAGLVSALAERIRGLWGRRTRLHEDLEEDAGIRQRSAKQRALVDIVEHERGVVVYAREVEVVEHLGRLQARRRRMDFAHAIDRLRRNIKRFQDGELDALAMTRALGLRGLDFPDADAMVLYSAKRDWRVMDQEMCRIRGQRRHRPIKRVYILYYSGTYEWTKVETVVAKLLVIKDGRFQRYSVDSLRSRSGLKVAKRRLASRKRVTDG